MQMIFTPDFIINTIRRDSLRIAESFDELCGDDMEELSLLLSESSTIIFRGGQDHGWKNEELQRWSCDILMNGGVSLTAAIYLLRAGYRLVPGAILRSTVETMAVCLHGIQKPQDFPQIRSGKFNSPKAINTAKKVILGFGELYGLLSNLFAHAGRLHHSYQPLVPYEIRDNDLICNLRAIRVSVWFHYVVAEFAFINVVGKPRFWHVSGHDKVVYEPSEAELQWQKRFLFGPDDLTGA